MHIFGSHRRKWKDNNKMDIIKETGYEVLDWIQLSQRTVQ
jgi:hypothetical protein